MTSTAKTTKTVRAKAKPAPYDSAKGLAAINGNIALIRKNSNAFRDLLQDTLVMICRHGKNTGDVTAMARLMNDGLTNWYRRGPICDYVADFTPVKIVFKGGVAVASLGEKEQRKPWNIEGMVATPFWDHKSLAKDNELPQDIDEVATDVIKFAERLSKRLKDGKIAPTAIDHVTRLIASIKGAVQTVRQADPKPGRPELGLPANTETPQDATSAVHAGAGVAAA